MIECLIYDETGTRQDVYWMMDKYGAVTIGETGTQYGQVELWENTGGSSALVVTCLDQERVGIRGAVVVFGWPDGENHGVTNADGAVGFGMGPGAYHKPETPGPHFIATGQIRIDGLGMKFGTNHHHMDVVLVEGAPEPPPEPPPEPEPEPETGACCFGTVCVDGLTQLECLSQGGEYQGDGVLCSSNPCMVPPEPVPPVDNVWMTLFEKLDRIIDHLEVLCVASSCNQSVGGVTFESWKPEDYESTVTMHQPGRLTRILSGSSSDTEGADLS